MRLWIFGKSKLKITVLPADEESPEVIKVSDANKRVAEIWENPSNGLNVWLANHDPEYRKRINVALPLDGSISWLSVKEIVDIIEKSGWEPKPM